MKFTLASATSLLVMLPQAIQGATTYHCRSEQSNKFRHDCITAYTRMIIAWTDENMMTYVPTHGVSFVEGSCTAHLKGSNTAVPIMDLITAFDQLGSQCQNGYFFFDNRWLVGDLVGRAGWNKRDLGADQNATDPDDGVEHFQARAAPNNNNNNNHKIEKREHHPITSRPTNLGILSLARVTSVVLPGMFASAPIMVEQITDGVSDLFDMAETVQNHLALSVGVSATTGSTVAVATFAMQLEAEGSWQDLFNRVGQDGIDLAWMYKDAIVDWANNDFVAAAYTVTRQATGDVLCMFILNGINGQLA